MKNQNYNNIFTRIPPSLIICIALFLFLYIVHSVTSNFTLFFDPEKYVSNWAKEANLVTDIYIEKFQYNGGNSVDANKALEVIDGVNKIKKLKLKVVPTTEFTRDSIKKSKDIDMNATYNIQFITEGPNGEKDGDYYITQVTIKKNY